MTSAAPSATQVVGLLGPTGRRDDLVTERGQQRDRDAADAARRRPVTRTGPSPGSTP